MGTGWRAFWIGVITCACLTLSSRVSAQPRPTQGPPKLPSLPLSIAVAEVDGVPVVTDRWLSRQVSEAQRLLEPHGVFVAQAERRKLPAHQAKLETADDRDALAEHVDKQVINVFIVKSLRDVDDPKLMRQGVRWRLRRNLRKDYVIVSAAAMPTTLCHELGHYFGNGHSFVVNNIMSYRRDDPSKVAFDDRQGIKMRRTARALLSRGRVVSVEQLAKQKAAAAKKAAAKKAAAKKAAVTPAAAPKERR
ncbi:MAG: hypothetical protein JRI68_06840 [Deltaproteobacteria bacterium]|nr:hypothetical protein [Deltaproteobacteria bacterium]